MGLKLNYEIILNIYDHLKLYFGLCNHPLLYIVSSLFTCLLFYKILWHYLIYVNCWFCNTNLRVHFSRRNKFTCPSCFQYNGFTDDGDYNCTIEAQYDPSKNSSSYHDYRLNTQDNSKFKNGLCEMCNFKQSLKVRAIAEFSSLSENYADVDNFRNKLEDMYDFCKKCEATVHQTLGKQNSILKLNLIAWRVQQSKIVKNFFVCDTSSSTMLRKINLIMPIISLYLIASKLFCCYLVSSLNIVTTLDEVSEFILLCTAKIDIVLSSIGLICNSCLYRTDFTFYKIPYTLIGWMLLLLLHNDVNTNFLKDQTSYYIQLFLVLINFLMLTHLTKKYKNVSSPKSFVLRSTSIYDKNSISPIDQSKSPEAATTPVDLSFEDLNEGELGIPLNNLKIGTPNKRNLKDFENINTFKSDFDNVSQRSRGSSILQPSKFSNKITQSSWVAGGYWGESPNRRQTRQRAPVSLKGNEELNFFSSRSSSQSSGYFSQSSDYSRLFSSQSREQLPIKNLNSKWGGFDERKSTDSLDACSVSSCFSTNCNTDKDSLAKTQFSDCRTSTLCFPLNHSTPNTVVTAQKQLHISWCYILLAFALGFSISANVFLFYLFYRNDVHS